MKHFRLRISLCIWKTHSKKRREIKLRCIGMMSVAELIRRGTALESKDLEAVIKALTKELDGHVQTPKVATNAPEPTHPSTKFTTHCQDHLRSGDILVGVRTVMFSRPSRANSGLKCTFPATSTLEQWCSKLRHLA